MDDQINARGYTRRSFLAGAVLSLAGAAGAGFLPGCSPARQEETKPSESAEERIKEPTETREASIVIVGSGAAGCMAALEAAELGLKNIVIVTKSGNATDSNFNEITGTCAIETPATEAIGQTYSLEDLYKHMISYAHWTVNPRLLKQSVMLLPSNIEIMDSIGIETTLLGDRYNVGFVDVHGFTGKNKGENFDKALAEKGVEILYGTPATHILTADGKVTGVQAENGKNVINVNAKAVLVCTGGYLANDEMMKDVYGGVTVVNMGSRNNTGDGQRMVIEAGGMVDRIYGLGMNDIYGMNQKSTISVFNANPFMQLAFYGGLLTDPCGNRFMNEYMLAQEPMSGGGEATLHTQRYYAVFSENAINSMKNTSYYESIGSPAVWTSAATMFNAPLTDFDKSLATAQEEGWCFKASSIEELAEKTGLSNLQKTVAEYDRMAAQGVDELFYKREEFLHPIEDGSSAYYAFEYNPSAFNTFGGPRTDEQCRALDSDHNPIPGLYVAGVENGSLFCTPYYDAGGSCSGLSMSSGRLAARNMAEYVKAE